MVLKAIAPVFLVFFLNGASAAQDGTLELQRLPKSARSLSLGGCDGTASYPSSIFYNPAVIASLKKAGAEIMYTRLFQLSHYGSLSAVYRIKPSNIVLGLGYDRNQVDDILPFDELQGDSSLRRLNPELRSQGIPSGNAFSVADESVRFGLARDFNFKISSSFAYAYQIPVHFSLGADYFIYRQDQMLSRINSRQIQDLLGGNQDLLGYCSGLDIGACAGFILKYNPVSYAALREFRLGGAVQNVFKSAVNWQVVSNYQETTLSNKRINLSYYEYFNLLRGSVRLLWDVNKLEGMENRLGVEYGFKDIVFLRGGWKTSSLMFGAGLHFPRGLYFDYAFSREEFAVTPFWISLGISF